MACSSSTTGDPAAAAAQHGNRPGREKLRARRPVARKTRAGSARTVYPRWWTRWLPPACDSRCGPGFSGRCRLVHLGYEDTRIFRESGGLGQNSLSGNRPSPARFVRLESMVPECAVPGGNPRTARRQRRLRVIERVHPSDPARVASTVALIVPSASTFRRPRSSLSCTSIKIVLPSISYSRPVGRAHQVVLRMSSSSFSCSALSVTVLRVLQEKRDQGSCSMRRAWRGRR